MTGAPVVAGSARLCRRAGLRGRGRSGPGFCAVQDRSGRCFRCRVRFRPAARPRSRVRRNRRGLRSSVWLWLRAGGRSGRTQRAPLARPRWPTASPSLVCRFRPAERSPRKVRCQRRLRTTRNPMLLAAERLPAASAARRTRPERPGPQPPRTDPGAEAPLVRPRGASCVNSADGPVAALGLALDRERDVGRLRELVAEDAFPPDRAGAEPQPRDHGRRARPGRPARERRGGDQAMAGLRTRNR